MKRSPHPRRKCACESRRAGASQARFEKRSPRKGTKTELSFAQMSPYVSREDLREGGETYLTW